MNPHETEPGSVRSYTIGFALSIALTLAAYIVARGHSGGGWGLIYVLAGLAVVQLFVQLFFFLHLGRGSSSRWNTVVLCFAAMVVLILVLGSLWIMKHLNYSHDSLTPQQTNQAILKDEGYTPPSSN